MTLSVDSGLTVLARADWPESDVDTEPPELAMFVRSSFSLLVAEVAARCLRRHYGAPPADEATGDRTAVVLLSVAGDVVSTAEVVAAVDRGVRLTPMLFFQSVPNAAVGHVAATWGLAGPVVCLSPPGNPTAGPSSLADTALDYAAELIGDGDADHVLVLVVEQGEAGGGRDRAAAMLVTGPSAPSRRVRHGSPRPSRPLAALSDAPEYARYEGDPPPCQRTTGSTDNRPNPPGRGTNLEERS